MNRLSFKHKIVLSISVMFTLLIAPSVVIITNFIAKNSIYEKQLVGLLYSTHISALITSIQIHRGAFNGYLSGNVDFINLIKEAQVDIEESLSSLLQLNHRHSILEKREFYFIKKSLEDIRFDNIATQKSSSYIFIMHSNIISELMSLLKISSFETKFLISSEPILDYVGTMLTIDMPSLKEYSGQLRGEAVVFLADSSTTKLEREKLSSLKNSIELRLNSIVENSKLYRTKLINKQLSSIVYATKEMLDTLEPSIISTKKTIFNQILFFEQATALIDKQLKLEEILFTKYELKIEKLKKEMLFGFIFLLIIFIAILFISIYLSSFLYVSTLFSLQKLSSASKRIENGETDIQIKVDLKDEIGEALLAFNSMSHRLAENITFLDIYKMAIDEISAVSKADTNGDITYVNRKFCDIYGYTEEELIGKPHNILRHPDMSKKTFKELWSTVEKGKIWKGVVKNRSKDGDTYISETTILPIVDTQGSIVEYIAIRHDITELEKFKKELEEHNIDLLTNLPNRNKLIKELPLINKASLIYLNINNFSGLNQFYGSKIADSVLIGLSIHLKEISQKLKCRVYRLRSDDFLLLFDGNCLSKENYEKVVKEIIDDIESKEVDSTFAGGISINVYAGVAFHKEGEKTENLLECVDIARKIAKSENKKWLLYRSSMANHTDYQGNIERINEIKHAIKHDQIEVHYQPIIDNIDNKIVKYEALVRLVRDDGKILSPFFFLDIAIKANLYPKITEIVINKAFKRFENLPQYDLSINLNIEDITNKNTVSFILNKLKQFPNPNRIIFEIVESQKIKDYKFIAKFIEKIKKLDAKIAIDDFGTGYSNFDHVINLGADFIKIDGSLIKNIDSDRNSQILVKSIIGLSKNLKAKSVVEFVHSKEIAQIVKKMGADFSQGYYLGEPKEEIIQK